VQALALPAQALRGLPDPCTLVCRAADLNGKLQTFWVTTSREHHSAARRSFLPALHGHEWTALVIAAADARATLALSQWLTPEAYGVRPMWYARGTVYDLCGGGLLATESTRGWDAVDLRVTVGDVLEHFRAELVDIDPPLTAARPEGLL
jgi:hypothetical protein